MSKSRRPVRYSVHPGVVMAKAIIGNLKEKTGRSLEQWVTLAKKDGPAGTKPRLTWLKSEHGLGGTTARLTVDRAEGRGAEARRSMPKRSNGCGPHTD